jgi:hypothetical protein
MGCLTGAGWGAQREPNGVPDGGPDGVPGMARRGAGRGAQRGPDRILDGVPDRARRGAKQGAQRGQTVCPMGQTGWRTEGLFTFKRKNYMFCICVM